MIYKFVFLKIFRISDKIVKTTHIAKSAIADKNGLWTTVISAAVFIMENGKVETDNSPLKPELAELQQE